MNALRKLIVGVVGLAVSMAAGILVLHKGWGLDPVNWWWIICGSLFGHILGLTLIEIGKGDDDE